MKKNLTLLWLCSLLTGGITAQNIRYVEYDMPNGLKVLLHEDHSTPIVAVSVMYHVGSKKGFMQRLTSGSQTGMR